MLTMHERRTNSYFSGIDVSARNRRGRGNKGKRGDLPSISKIFDGRRPRPVLPAEKAISEGMDEHYNNENPVLDTRTSLSAALGEEMVSDTVDLDSDIRMLLAERDIVVIDL